MMNDNIFKDLKIFQLISFKFPCINQLSNKNSYRDSFIENCWTFNRKRLRYILLYIMQNI